MKLHRLLSNATVLMIGCVMPLAAAGGGDVFGQAGILHIGSNGGTHALVGGGGSVDLGKHAAAFGELNYSPTGDYGLSSSSLGISTHIMLLGGGVRVYIPTGNDQFRLYIPATAGYLRWTVTGTASGVSASASANGGYFGTGFGAEIGKKFGIRPEFRYERFELSYAGTTGGANAITVGAGVFYRIGGK